MRLYFDLGRERMTKLALRRHTNKILGQNNQEPTAPGLSRPSHVHSITISGPATRVNGVPGRFYRGQFGSFEWSPKTRQPYRNVRNRDREIHSLAAVSHVL